MTPNETIKVLHAAWLRPRYVMRALADEPSNVVDYVLGAAQGVAGLLYLSKLQNAGLNGDLATIIGKALLVGTLLGTANLYVLALIYSRLGRRIGASPTRHQTMHMLAYGAVPIAASIALWLLTAAVAGNATFMTLPPADSDVLITGLLQMLLIAHLLLSLWSLLLQVMGFSELLGVPLARAFLVWLIGQLISLPAAMLIVLIIEALMPGSIPA